MVAEVGTVTRALLELARDDVDHRDLAGRICQACVDGLDVDGAAISLLTASVSRETLWATDATAELLEDLQFTLNEGACMEAPPPEVPSWFPTCTTVRKRPAGRSSPPRSPSRPGWPRCSRCRCNGAR
jgi:hypothetical protein